MDSFGDRLRCERKRLKLTQKELALKAGSSEPSQRRYESSSRQPSADYLEKIASMGIDIVYILTGQRAIDAIAAKEEWRATPTTEIDHDQLALVPRYDAQGAAGDGVINLDEAPADHLAFPRDWLVANGLRAATAFLMTVRGDSMAPTLQDGDLIMVDRARTGPRSGRIYVYNDPAGDGTRIKRIDADGGGLVIRSDNPAAAPALEMITDRDRADDLLARIIGEVVWCGHKLS